MINSIKQAIDDYFVVDISYLKTIPYLEIKEENPESKFQPLQIFLENKDKSYMIKFDMNKCNLSKRDCQKKSIFFDHNCTGINQGCDYVLFTEFENKNYVILIECKSEKLDKSHIKSQLINSKFFCHYLFNLISFHLNKEINIDEMIFINLLFYSAPNLRIRSSKQFKDIRNSNYRYLKYPNAKKNKKSRNLKLNLKDIIIGWGK